mmetsp:Transcript_23255/g.25497  ORF Transcript_23255/g.25497 Transcript_23255/m.25497 type:complete len:209 (-) Transcript_23255:157-783(-)
MQMILIFCLLFLLSLINALYIDLKPGDMRCIGQELDQLETAVFAMSASSTTKDPLQRVMGKISDPDEEDLFYDKVPITGKIKEFEHLVEQRGVYEMCFELQDGRTPVRVFFHVDYKPVTADGKDLSHVVSKDEVPSLLTDLQSIDMKIREISSEIEHAKRQEAFLNKANETTSSRLEWFSMLSIIVLLGTSVWQILYLRSFFTSKKLL